MMMHQLLHWPEQFDPALWPFALKHAVFIWNNMLRHRSGLTPLELFTGMKQPQNSAILRSRVWGCPAYVLDPKLQDGKKFPKWSKRSRCGVYLGVSPEHHTTVGRILNAETGSISPQYHVVYWLVNLLRRLGSEVLNLLDAAPNQGWTAEPTSNSQTSRLGTVTNTKVIYLLNGIVVFIHVAGVMLPMDMSPIPVTRTRDARSFIVYRSYLYG
jgi:hypothetical protein